MFALGGLIDAPDFVGDPAQCTFCLNASRDDFNSLTYAKKASEGAGIFSAEASCDLDHILVQEKYRTSIESAEFERVFMDDVVEGVNPFGLNESVTMSDHYGITMDVRFNCKKDHSGKGSKGGKARKGKREGISFPGFEIPHMHL